MRILEATGLSIYFDEVVLFEDLNLFVNEKECIVLDGHVGSGKSILMRTLTGLHWPSEGKVYYKQEPFEFFLDKKFFQQRKKICYLLEGVEPLANLSTYENMALYFRANTMWPEDRIEKAIIEKLRSVKLEGKIHLRPSLLSMEERVILNFLMNLKIDSEIFVLDEIFTFLSGEVKDRIKNVLLQEINGKEKTILMGKMDAEYLELAANRVWKIKNQKVVEE